MSDTKSQIQEAQRTSSRTGRVPKNKKQKTKQNKNTKPTRIIFKLHKIRDKEKNPERSQKGRETSYLYRNKDRN